MGFKQPRLGPQLLAAAKNPEFFRQAHVIFGGTGAVGGATAFHLISFFEEAAARGEGWREAKAAGDHPRIIITGRTKQEIRQFTSLLYALQARDHHGAKPTLLPGIGYRTAGGVEVELHVLAVDPSVPELAQFAASSESARRQAVAELLAHGNVAPDAAEEARARLLEHAVEERVGTPFTTFLDDYREQRGLPGGQERFRSAVVAIPLASVATYKLGDLDEAGPYLGVARGSERMQALKDKYLAAIRDDLAHVATDLADEVLAAHTTAVGGMYDEEEDGSRTIRLGFAHSASGEKMREKQKFAELLARLYAERGIKMLVTAAAIGVDTVLVDKAPPINGAIRGALRKAISEGEEVITGADLRAGVIKIYPPLEASLFGEPHTPVQFRHGSPLVMSYALKSGENGFFSVSNADALYRVMRVASSAELGLVLARTAVFGDHPATPLFPNNVCYFTETDNSRQVFDLLYQPPLLRNQLSGLQPKALQDLGSAKHQAELHTLGLLIMLHRLKTLNLEAIPRGVSLAAFDPLAYFDENSRVLTLERAASFSLRKLAEELKVLVTAREDSALDSLQHFYQADPGRQQAAHRVLQAVLKATWAIPSLGSPLLFEEDGKRHLLCGPYAAPLDHVITHRDSLERHLRETFDELSRSGAVAGDEESFESFVEFNIANAGFVDLRPLAVLVTTRSAKQGLAGKVRVFREEEPFLAALRELPPYSYFTTSGLLALMVRLRSLYGEARNLDLSLGTANEFRAHFIHDQTDRPLLVPGLVEALRMVSEGLDKNTGSDRLDGRWGYGT